MDQAATHPLTGAIAVWAKTPGLSPVKTRLAATIGAEAAEEFYRLSVRAVAAVVRRAAEIQPDVLTPYWAVAEEQALAHPLWRDFPTVYQGAGGLGSRLSHVYDTLLQRHPWVIFIGADAPQITPELLGQAGRTAAEGDWVLGPAEDGGFYLFGGSKPLPRDAWEQVPYSVPETARVLADRLQQIGYIQYLPETFDVDTAEELAKLRAELVGQQTLLLEQRELLRWLDHST